MAAETLQKTPWHLWAVGVIAMLWNGFGCADFVMTMTKGDAYMASAGMTPEQIAFMHAAPAWLNAVWGIGVFGGVLGGLLLLLKKRWAVEVFVVSFLSFIASLLYYFVIEPMPGASSTMMIMQAVIFASCVFFIWYAMRARKSGLLT